MRAVRASSARRAAIDDAGGRYIEFCKSDVPERARPQGLAHRRRLRARRRAITSRRRCSTSSAPTSIAIGAEPNGININDGVGATHPKHLKAAVVEHKADIGIALDGDGDRLLMVDRDGRAYDGDQLLYVIAMDYRRRNALGRRRRRAR